ncbi:MAG: toll/interleukin-1 receptor domain-containing protein [Bacteroidota bacterium]
MKDICVSYPKENKALAKKIVSKLESDNISCWVAPRDFKVEEEESVKKVIEESGLLLLILDKNSGSNKETTKALEFALENELEVIPYVIDKIESDLYSEYFFYTFSWVDAHEESFDDAYEILLEAIDELSGKDRSQKKSSKKGRKITHENSISLKQLGIAAGVVIALIVAWFAYEEFSGNKNDELIVGEWRLSDYSDNLRRSPQDSIDFITTVIPSIKKNALLIFNDDKTFERRGFTPEPQIGEWRLSEDATILYLEPRGLGRTDQLTLQGLSENSFTIVVNEVMQDSSRVTTKLTFSK